MTLSGKDFVATLQRALQGRGPGSKAAHWGMRPPWGLGSGFSFEGDVLQDVHRCMFYGDFTGLNWLMLVSKSFFNFGLLERVTVT